MKKNSQNLFARGAWRDAFLRRPQERMERAENTNKNRIFTVQADTEEVSTR